MTARIYTVFEFNPATPEGIVNYTRHLVAGNSFEEAHATIANAAILRPGTQAYMTSQDATEACRYEVMTSVNTLRDPSMTQEELRRWIKSSTSAHYESGDRHEPSHCRIW